ncbi:hypothetical protein EVAR_49322_1 [Eumeta japonica]|uniref:Uncharacterized protein n=1 Tax=Eumeta variegata TaxID=151549 RepID=A0A4C1YBV5_EUMVA|nr:hypothetical protein EVAR_49322_1 [Eumeta japonica]
MQMARRAPLTYGRRAAAPPRRRRLRGSGTSTADDDLLCSPRHDVCYNLFRVTNSLSSFPVFTNEPNIPPGS